MCIDNLIKKYADVELKKSDKIIIDEATSKKLEDEFNKLNKLLKKKDNKEWKNLFEKISNDHKNLYIDMLSTLIDINTVLESTLNINESAEIFKFSTTDEINIVSEDYLNSDDIQTFNDE